MRKKSNWIMLLTYFVLVLALASSNASAVIRDWDDGADPNELWTAKDNWSGDTVPLAADDANLNMPDTNCLIDSTVTNAVASYATVGFSRATCYLDMTGGKLTTGNHVIVGDEPCGIGVFNISDGNVICNRMWVGYGSSTAGKPAAYGTLNISGGKITCASKFELGKEVTGVGTINMSGGTIIITNGADDFEMGKKGDANLVMTATAGDINVLPDGDFKISQEAGKGIVNMYGGRILTNDLCLNWATPTSGTARLNLYAGEVNCVDLKMEMGSVKPIIDIHAGTLYVEADEWLDDITDVYIPQGWIIGYGGDGVVVVTPFGGGIGYTTITAKPGDPNLAWNPYPKNYASVQWTTAGVTCTWEPAQTGKADNHDVYFGTDWGDVNDANNLDPSGPNEVFKGNQDPCSYGPLTLVLDKIYYWRIDENDIGVKVYKGDVWQFRMTEFVEDFESYANQAALKAVWKLTGSDIDINDTIVNTRPGKSMRYDYNNAAPAPYYTEAYANTTGPNSLPVGIKDWTKADIKALTLYFFGATNNAAEDMYVGLRDTNDDLAIVYYEDPNDLNEPEWHEWNIKMSDFDTNGFDSNDVNRVYIGFGNRQNPTADGNGTVYFDDIRLHPRRCVAMYGPDGDVDGDCLVDINDVNVMQADWLEMDYNRPGANGVLRNGAQFVASGHANYGNAVDLDGVNDYVDLDDSDFSDFRNKTIAFWVKIRSYPATYRYMFYFSDDDDANPYRIYFMTYKETSPEGDYLVRVRFVDEYTDAKTANLNVWKHLAFVIQNTADGLCKGKFYVDATAVVGGEITGKPRHSGEAVGVNLGSADDGTADFANVLIDDFRVYDKALTGGEITTVKNGGHPPGANMLLYYDCNEAPGGTIAKNSSTFSFYHPLFSDAELYDSEPEGSRIVNFRDFAILANDWLKEQLWP